MKTLPVRVISEGETGGNIIPLSIVLVDEKDIRRAGIDHMAAIAAVASSIDGPCGINIFNMDAVTTTSDGVMVEGAIVRMAATDRGKVNPDFGALAMSELARTDILLNQESHLIQWDKRYQGRPMFRGPDPANKIIPVHNAAITGRAANNNSATEMMNIVTMEEILLPILGQLQIMKGEGNVLLGNTGEVISVGIGMTVAETFGRVFPSRQFRAGETAHGSGKYAKTLKRDIPCIVAEKSVLAGYILNALEDGCVPGRDIGCSPAVLTVAKLMGCPIDLAGITAKAWEELESIGIRLEDFRTPTQSIPKQTLLERADALIPGAEGAVKYPVGKIAPLREIPLG